MTREQLEARGLVLAEMVAQEEKIAALRDENERLKADWPKGAVAVMSNLDMLTEEPLELAVALRKLSESKIAEGDDEREAQIWAKFSQAMSELVHDLQALNEPSRAGDAKSE